MHRASQTTSFAIVGALAVAACLALLLVLQPQRGTAGRSLQPVVAGAEAPPGPLPATAGQQPPAGQQPAPAATADAAPVVDPSAAPAPAATVQPVAVPAQRSAPSPVNPNLQRLVDVPQAMEIHARANSRAIVGVLPANSPYYGTPVRAWIQQLSSDGRWGKVSIPWSGNGRRTGWVRIDGLRSASTTVEVHASVSRREVTVLRNGKVLFRTRAAVGRAGSATPVGHYFVTDRVPLGHAHPAFGSYAFGLSGVQSNLPRGWQGGNQLAIHGTNNPGSIGTRASAGCLRVSESALRRLRPLLQLGTPVVIEA